MQPHDMAEQGLLGMPISSLITRVSGRCSWYLVTLSLGYYLQVLLVQVAVSAREVSSFHRKHRSLGWWNEISHGAVLSFCHSLFQSLRLFISSPDLISLWQLLYSRPLNPPISPSC